MICKTKTKQNKLLEGKDGQDDAHVGAMSHPENSSLILVMFSHT